MKKIIIALLVIYAIQFGGSCSNDNFEDCFCEDGRFEATIDNLAIEPLLNISNNDLLTLDTFSNDALIPKEKLILSTQILASLDKIASTHKKKPSNNFGFNSVLACSCAPPPTNVLNPIQSIKVSQWDDDSEEYIDVTESFAVFNFFDDSESIISINEALVKTRLFEEQEYFISNYYLLIDRPEEIFESTRFQIEIELASGNSLIQISRLINFQ